MIITTIVINSDTRQDIAAAIDALARNLRGSGLADTERLEQTNSLITTHAVVMFSRKEES